MGIRGFTGQFNSTMDDKGRMILPVKLKSQLQGESLILTRGIEGCLWLFCPKEWDRLEERLAEHMNLFDRHFQMVQRRLLAPAHEVSLDKMGRIKIAPALIKSARLGRECCVLGLGDHIEIWDAQLYECFEEECAESVKGTWQRMGERFQ